MSASHSEISTPLPEPQLFGLLAIAGSLLGLESIQTIVELGARDCKETVAFHGALPDARVYAFECNPQTLPLCREAVADVPNVELVEAAATSYDGTTTFYPIDPNRTVTTWVDGNPGASSLFRASGKYPVETYVQQEITVPATSLRTFMLERSLTTIDLLWMDIQGAELLALEGLAELLSCVKIIHTEVEFIETYTDQPLFAEVKAFLNDRGFVLHDFTAFGEYSADAVFVNSSAVPAAAGRMARLRDRTLRWRRKHGICG